MTAAAEGIAWEMGKEKGKSTCFEWLSPLLG